MTEPQTWVLLGVFSTLMLGGMTFMSASINRTLTAMRDGINIRFDAVHRRFDDVDRRIDRLTDRMDETDTKIDGLRTEMTTLTVRVDHLDRDVNAVIRRMGGEPPGQ